MSILSFFKRKTRLPDPKGLLSTLVPLYMIVLANKEVEKKINKEAYVRSNKRGKYHM